MRLAERDFTSAERMLRNAAGDDLLTRDYAALLLSRGKLDAEIARLRAKLGPGDQNVQRQLAWMLRTKGDLAGAVVAAKAAKDGNLLEGFLAENGNWKELAAIDAKTDLDKLVRESAADRFAVRQKLARIITARNLAGDKAACDEAVTVVTKALRQRPEYFESKVINALFLNDRVDACAKAFAQEHVTAAFDILASQNRAKEAFRLVKIDVPLPAKIDWPAWLKNGNAVPDQQRRWLASRVFYELHRVGEDRHADELLEAYLAMLKDHISETDWQFDVSFLIATDAETGRSDHCDELASKLLALQLEHPERVVAALYRRQDYIVTLVWDGLRKQFPDQDQLQALKRLRRTIAAKRDPKGAEEFRSLAAHMIADIRSGKTAADGRYNTAEDRARKLLALAGLCQRQAEPKLAGECLAAIGAADLAVQTLVERGHLYLELKKWDEAARSFEAAWGKDPKNAAALYLLGWTKAKRGREAEGRKQMEAALMLPLADGVSRLHLAVALDRLHQDEEALRQRLLIMRLAPPHDESIVMAVGHLVDVKDVKPGTANEAANWRKLAVEYTLTRAAFISSAWSESKSHLQWRASAHRFAALDLLRAGKTAAAIEEIHQAETIMPEDVQIALDCDAELRKLHAVAEADALYRRIADRLQADCRDFPRDATCRNDLAWLAANLDRDLEMALANAQCAVVLAPQSAGILDTLAEVQFRRGDRAQAIQLARRCVELDGDGSVYKDRLARFGEVSGTQPNSNASTLP